MAKELAALAERAKVDAKMFAGVAELADAPDLGSGGEIRRGSSPLPGTKDAFGGSSAASSIE